MNMPRTIKLLGKGVLTAGLAVLAVGQAAAPAATTQTHRTAPHQPSRYAAGAMTTSTKNYYATQYGVDQLAAQLAESGQLVRVGYRILDPRLANQLLDKVSNPSLLDEKRHAVLSVPQMEKVGPLRQTGPAETGKSYWVLFSNKGGVVQAGDRVSVVIGAVRIDGIIVDK
jgi:hypothetical protein